MAMNNASADGDVMADLNTTPLIDVLLVLLVLLLITLPVQTHAVKLDMLPGLPSSAKPVIVDLSIDFDNGIFWNDQKITRAELDGRLMRASRQSPQPEVHLTADRLARYDIVAKVMSDAQRLGVTKLSIVNTGDR